MVRRPVLLAFAALVASIGCNAGTSGGLRKQEPPMARETISKARIIAQHNKNAATIQSLRAAPSIVFAAEDAKGKVSQGSLKGRMAMEREKDFRLEIYSTLARKQADIGSNTKGFWFWVHDNSERALYVCDYDQVNSSPLAATMQPDWILEAMGLREISEREAATINATKGDKPGQLVLTQLRPDAKGGTSTKVTIVDETTGEILEHRLYSGAKEKLLARATITETKPIEMLPTDTDPNGSTVTFPSKLKLEWVVEKFSLEIAMGDTLKINPAFLETQRAILFTEPLISGAVRTDLAKLGGAPASASRVYESAPRSGVRLGKPEVEPAGFEDAGPSPRTSRSRSAELPPLPPTGYIGPQVPRSSDGDAVPALAGPGPGGAVFLR